MSEDLLANVIGLDPGEEVELYIIDLTPAGYNVVFFFTPSDQLGGSLWFGGYEFTSRPIQITGFEKSSDQGPPEPTLVFGNIDKGGNALLKEYNDLLGAKITRIQTFSHFLDKLPDGSDNPNSDPAAMMLPEIWFIEQKVGNTPIQITWRLKSALDLNGKKIPARLVLKDVCTRVYRSWDPVLETFKYSLKNACPYTDAIMYTRNGDVTLDPTKDECSKDYKGCNWRFPDEPLPGWFFPGVTRLPR